MTVVASSCRCGHTHRSSRHASETTTTTGSEGLCASLLCHRFVRAQWSTCRCMAITAPHGGEGSDACAHGGDMSSRASQWPCPQPSTTASTRWRLVKSTTGYGLRRRTGPGRLRTKLYGDRSPKQPGMRCSSSCLTKTPQGCGPRFSPSLGRRSGSSGTLWSTLSTSCTLLPWCKFSMHLCRRRWNSCRTSCISSTRSRLFRAGYRSAQDSS